MTKHILVMETTGKARGGNRGGQPGLKAKVAAGMAILGCAAALVFSGQWAGNAGQSQPQSVPLATQVPAGTDDYATSICAGTTGPFACQIAGTDDFATNVCVGTAGPFACQGAQPASVPTVGGSAVQESERTLSIEQNVLHEVTPAHAVPGVLPGPAQFHGEDH